MTACVLCGGDPDVAISATWVIRLDHAIASANKRISNTRQAGYAYSARRDMAQSSVEYWRRELSIPPARSRRRVRFTRLIGRTHTGRKRILYDAVNFAHGCKYVLDAMVRVGLLIGDRAQDVEDYYEQTQSEDGTEGLRITLEEFAT